MSLVLACVVLILSGCGGGTAPLRTSAFEELPEPIAGDAAGWEEVGEGLHASFISVDEKPRKSAVPVGGAKFSHKISGWKGERLNAQILLWTSTAAEGIRIEPGRFEDTGGSKAVDMARARFVRYVMTDEFGTGCGYRNPGDYAASLVPDMLDDIDVFDIEAGTVRPVWITVDIPRDIPAGNYTAPVTVAADGIESLELKLEVEVIDRELPPSSGWKYYLDLWQHPSAVARYEGLVPWSDEHFSALEPYMRMLAGAGQKVITATLNKDPWNNQSFDAYEEMITWTLDSTGTWSYDYSVFDKWVAFMHDMGITEVINCYSMLPWNNELQYCDESGELVTVVAEPGTPEFERMWIPFLIDFTNHLEEKGWLGKTNIAMDERSPAHMDITFELLERVSPGLGIALADNHQSYRKYTHVRDLCVGINSRMDDDDIAKRREGGLVSTWYVCCSHPFPNFFTFSPSAEAVYAGWYTSAAGYSGMLHWSFMNWVEEPLTDSRFRTWPAGDTYMVYPGGRSSIRFERLLEGIQDAEKIRILRAGFESSGAQPQLTALDEAVKQFDTISPEEGWQARLSAAKRLLNELSRY